MLKHNKRLKKLYNKAIRRTDDNGFETFDMRYKSSKIFLEELGEHISNETRKSIEGVKEIDSLIDKALYN